MKDIKHASAILAANYAAMYDLVPCSGSYGINGISIDALSQIKGIQVDRIWLDEVVDDKVKTFKCSYCGQKNLVNLSKLDVVSKVSCLACGASLI